MGVIGEDLRLHKCEISSQNKNVMGKFMVFFQYFDVKNVA
jgi:hypothetical protein